MKIPVVEAKNRFGAVLDRVVSGEDVIVERRGQPVAVLISYERYQAFLDWQEAERRQKALNLLRELASEAKARNTNLTEEERERLADKIVRDAMASLVERQDIRYEG